MELLKHTALELGAMIAKGEISSADVTDAVFAAIEAKDKDVNAYIGLSEELAMSQASACLAPATIAAAARMPLPQPTSMTSSPPFISFCKR